MKCLLEKHIKASNLGVMKLNKYQKHLYESLVATDGEKFADFVTLLSKPKCCDSFLEHYFNHTIDGDPVKLDFIMEALPQIEN